MEDCEKIVKKIQICKFGNKLEKREKNTNWCMWIEIQRVYEYILVLRGDSPTG